ncbi:MAG: DUF1802 family protein [candidate division NC10 bacterium]|nr:DUF1802 family protein [Candidatus Rokubacteria bacterium]MBI2563057.1 DUF1802 family protein [candidate division NC10 bacterium]
MMTANRIALKEWAVVCAEMAAGRQTILLRKGGIREPSQGFTVEHREFFLFPTYVHENEEDLTETARLALPEVARGAPPAGELHLELYAVVEAAIEVLTLEPLRRLEGRHILAWSAVERRFHYRRPGLHVIALRVSRLPEPLVVPNLFRYDGCRSWVGLESELPVTGARPVLDDLAFHQRMASLREALGVDPAALSGHRSA